MKRDSFIFYRSLYDGLKNIPDAERLQCYDAIVRYGLDGEEQAEGIPAAVLALVRPVIDSNNQRFLNGAKGGRPKTKQEPNNNLTETKQKPNNNQTKTKTKPNVNVNVNVNGNGNGSGSQANASVLPSEEKLYFFADID